MLMTTKRGRCSVFLEAKVKPNQTTAWSLQREYQRFNEGISTQVNSSNLFTQLYNKVRLVNGLKRGGLEELQAGLAFSASSTLRTRKLGKNDVVLSAVQQIMPYLDETFYLALIPDNPENSLAFFRDTLSNSQPEGYVEWHTTNYGFLCWCDVEEFCEKESLANTTRVLEFNRGQIY